jgi:hypothetical protein
VALAAASAPIWLEMSLFTECHGWMEKALDHLDATDRGTRQEMVLQCTLGLSLVFKEDEIRRPREALTRASELAESLQDFDYQLQALYGLVAICLRLEDFQGALAFARRVLMTTQLLAAHPDPSDDQIRHYLSGNLCRCGAYPQIVEAVNLAARKLRIG